MNEENTNDRPTPRRDPRSDHEDDRPRRRRDLDDADNDYEDDRPRRRRRDLDDEDDDYEDDRPRRRRPPPDSMDDPAIGLLLPVNTSVIAILAGYMGLFSVLCLPAPISLILGIVALRQLKKKPRLRGKGRAIFAIVMGTIFTLIPLVFLIMGSVMK